MDEVTDTELSLAVARIMYPKYKWKVSDCIVSGKASGMKRKVFDYQAKHCAFDMAVWLTRQYHSGTNPVSSLRYNTKISSAQLRSMLETKCPQRALAMTIKEMGE